MSFFHFPDVIMLPWSMRCWNIPATIDGSLNTIIHLVNCTGLSQWSGYLLPQIWSWCGVGNICKGSWSCAPVTVNCNRCCATLHLAIIVPQHIHSTNTRSTTCGMNEQRYRRKYWKCNLFASGWVHEDIKGESQTTKFCLLEQSLYLFIRTDKVVKIDLMKQSPSIPFMSSIRWGSDKSRKVSSSVLRQKGVRSSCMQNMKEQNARRSALGKRRNQRSNVLRKLSFLFYHSVT